MESLKIIIPLIVVLGLCVWVVRRVIADETGKAPITVPKNAPAFGKESWLTQLAIGLTAIFGIWAYYQRDHKSLGYIFLLGSIMTIIAGLTTSVSKRTRERSKTIAIATEPDKAALFDSPDAENKAKRRGYITLFIGVMMFLIWCVTYGFSSLAVGV